ncbi:hypothetical protein L0F63_000137 [Massospora cicadina]|nr:hypothetical protein L0F63_000137 [Massospora cicadina]
MCLPIKEQIEKIEFVVDNAILNNPAAGKRKKGAARLEPGTEVAVIKVYLKTDAASGTFDTREPEFKFPICACLQGSMIEMNQKVIENPFILFEEFEKEAYLGVILPKFDKIPIEAQNDGSKDTDIQPVQVDGLKLQIATSFDDPEPLSGTPENMGESKKPKRFL